MATSSAELLYDCHCQLGESPIWDERIQKLYFVDINSKKLHVFDPATQEDTVIDAPLMITTNILTPDPDIVLATLHRYSRRHMNGLHVIFQPESMLTKPLAGLSSGLVIDLYVPSCCNLACAIAAGQ